MVEITYHIIWSKTARQDMKAIALYYKKEISKIAAQHIIEAIQFEARRLLHMPFIGQIETSLIDEPKEYRYLISGNYKIIYHLNKDKIRINCVFDCRQDPNKLKHTIR